ncbi:MAG: hypothetical protein ACKO3K_13715 [Cuspidothrix sp.]
MKRFISTAVTAIALMGSLSTQAFAQTKPSAITTFLDRLGMNYEVQKDGSILILAGVDGNRTQNGFIVPDIGKIGNNDVIAVMSFSRISKTPPDEEKIKQLQTRVNDISSGWDTVSKEGIYSTFYYKIIPLNKDPNLARKDIIEILNIADTAEKELDSKDTL